MQKPCEPPAPLSSLFVRRVPDARIVAERKGEPVPWDQFRRKVAVLFARFQGDSGTRWLLICQDAVEFAAAFFALLHAGKSVILPANNQPGTILDAAAYAEGIAADCEVTGSKCTFVMLQNMGGSVGDTPSALKPINADSSAIFMYTSGSTGRPKCIRRTLSQFEAEIAALEASFGAQVGHSGVLATVSHQHIYGLLFRVLWPLAAGRRFAAETHLDPQTLVSTAKGRKRIVLVSSPAHLKRAVEVIDFSAIAERISLIFSSGGTLPRETAEKIRAATQRTPMEVLGSTETGGVAWRTQYREGFDALWRPLPGVRLSLRQRDEVLLVKSPYAWNPGWVPLGDRGRFVDDGAFELLGRVDRVVKVEEKRLSLSELETRLMHVPLVLAASCALLEGRRTMVGAVVVLNEAGRCILQDQGKRETDRRLRNALGQFFDRAVLPRKWRYVEALPLNGLGKVQGTKIQQLLES